MKQQTFFDEKIETTFGGTLNLGKRKNKRPLDTKRPIHLILKSTSSFKLLRRKKEINQTVTKLSKKFGIKIFEIGIHADHIHLQIQVGSRRLYNSWIRSVTARIVRKIEGLKWKFIPFTRINNWGREFKRVINYVKFNEIEGNFLLAAHLEIEKWWQQLKLSG